jgi:hypothetical protein
MGHFTIHAGLQLIAKEFRYLWIVIVTTAIYKKIQLTQKTSHIKFKHWADLKPYTS